MKNSKGFLSLTFIPRVILVKMHMVIKMWAHDVQSLEHNYKSKSFISINKVTVRLQPSIYGSACCAVLIGNKYEITKFRIFFYTSQEWNSAKAF